jgi:hypothetical protein
MDAKLKRGGGKKTEEEEEETVYKRDGDIWNRQ